MKALEEGKAGVQHCTHQLHARQHLQQRDEVVAVPQVLIEVIDVLAHLEGGGRGHWEFASRPLPTVHLKWLFQEVISTTESSLQLPKQPSRQCCFPQMHQQAPINPPLPQDIP